MMFMPKRPWLFALVLVPLALAVPLYNVASWRPRTLGVHPFGAVAVPNATQVLAPTYGLMASPDGAHLLSFTHGGQNMEPRGAALWDVDSGRVLWRKRQSNYHAWEPLCFAPDGKTVAMNHYRQLGSKAKPGPSIILCDVATGKPLTTLALSHNALHAAFSRDGQHLTFASGSEIRVWNVSARHEVSRLTVTPANLPGHTSLNLTLSRDGQKFLVNWIHFYDSPTPLHAELRDLGNKIYWKVPAQLLGQTLFSPDGRWLLRRGLEAAPFEMRDATTGALKWKRAVQAVKTMPIEGVWLPDSSGVVLADSDKFLVLDARTGQQVRSVPKFPQVGANFTVSSDGNSLYAISDFAPTGISGQIMRQRLR